MIGAPFFRSFRIAAGLAFCAGITAPSAQALPYYFEFGGTMATWTEGASVMSGLGLAASAPKTSFGVPMTFGLQLQDRTRGILFAIALQNRYLSGQTEVGETFNAMTTSPMLRIEFWKFVFGAAYTNYISKSMTFQKADGVTAALTLEGQFLFPITPEIDFGLQASRVSFTTASSSSASVIEYGVFFRLNFGFSANAKNERRKYKGWRYPFGSPLR
jgi:hypothetical protein